MKKECIASLFTMLFMIVFSAPCFAGWLIYNKPEFRGKIVDAETKQPIEGAVVVAIYKKHPIITGPAGGSSSIIHIKEVLTNKDGEFHISSYTTLIQPNSIEDNAEFIIYKPGYGGFPNQRLIPPKPMSTPAIETFFLKETFGKKGEIILDFGLLRKWKGTYGVVELPRLRTWKERRKANPSSISDIPKSKWPLLHNMIEKEDEWLRHNKGWRR